MVTVSDEEFQDFINGAMATLPRGHLERLENVAILFEDDPTPEQRQRLHLRPNQTLFGLYEGVPLAQRQGEMRLLPDKITIFKNPICASVTTIAELKEQIRHTLWHEVAHYYGLGHGRIRELEG